MARRKVRKYVSKDYIETVFENYFNTHRDEVIQYMIDQVNLMYTDKNFKTLEELHDFDIHGSYYGGFGLDCGWVWLKPKNKEQAHEWFLDNDRIPDYASPSLPYNTQSTTLKRMQLRRALEGLGLQDEYSLYERLD